MRLPQASDPCPVVPIVIRQATGGPNSPRVAVLDVDGLLVNHNLTGLFSVGEIRSRPFEKSLKRRRPIRACVPWCGVRVNSPGGGVAASDLMAEESTAGFRAFGNRRSRRSSIWQPAADLPRGRLRPDRRLAAPPSPARSAGRQPRESRRRHGQLPRPSMDAIKSGPLVDMGTVTTPLPDDVRKLFQEMADGFAVRFRTARYNPAPR